MIPSKKWAIKSFLIIFLAFLALGIPFKVMVLLEGFTEVRPVNAIPPIAGLSCGAVGALACGIGNLVADLFGTFNLSSILGFFANAISAYLPYRLWHIYSNEQPNFHKNINILKYVLICVSAGTTGAWILGFGLHYFFGQWIEVIYTYVVYNNIGFSIFLGLPVFIILSSDSINIPCVPRPKRFICLKNKKLQTILPIVYTVLMLVIFVGVVGLDCTPQTDAWMTVLSVISAVCLAAILI